MSHPAHQPSHNNRPRVFTPRPPIHWLIFVILLSAVVLLSVLAGSHYRGRRSALEAGGDTTAQATQPEAAARIEQGAGESGRRAKPAAVKPRAAAKVNEAGGAKAGELIAAKPISDLAPSAAAPPESDKANPQPGVEEANVLLDQSAGEARAGLVPTKSAPTSSEINKSKAESAREVTPKVVSTKPQTPTKQQTEQTAQGAQAGGRAEAARTKPREEHLTKAHAFNGDLRTLPFGRPVRRERPEREEPEPHPTVYPGTSATGTTGAKPSPVSKVSPVRTPRAGQVAPSAPAPTPITTFNGLDFANWGAGHPPDTNGDVGPTYFIQTVNVSVGVFRKSDGVRVAAFTLDAFMSQGNFGNLCDTDNFGDPVVLYDSFEDRWVITDFAFKVNGSGDVVNPPGSFQCFAVSKTGDPVSGGWNFYSINTAGGLGDYPKFGIWPDGIYMSTNMFDYAASGSFQNPRVYAFNKAQMYAGSPTVQVVSFDAPSAEFTLMPANARLQTGTPPAGSPNYFAVVWQFLNSEGVYKFHVDWDRVSLSTLTGPFSSTMTFWWEQFSRSGTETAPSPANFLDTLYPRLMMQNQYTNIGGVESLWTSHTVGAGNPTSNLTSAQSAIRYYQLNVTGGAVAANLTQDFTYSPDATLYRYMPSLAVDRAGNMAIGYTTSNATTNPALKYAARLAGDPANSITQTEQLIFQGTGSQSGNCGGATCIRWGDYSAMSLDPDGCTFWYTNEYYAANGLNDLTRIGSFSLPGCTTVGAGGTVTGTVKDNSTNPISGATVNFGSRTATTDGSGVYSFTNIPAGTYPVITASFPGFGSSTTTTVAVTDGGTTTKNFTLTPAPSSACLTDTTQPDFQLGVATSSLDLNTSPGNVTLSNTPTLDQSYTEGTTTGVSITATVWNGETFIPAVTGQLAKADVQLFCLSCTGTTPNLTVSIRATSSGLPTGADLATATIPGFSNGAGVFYTATFGSPPTLTAGTQYALIVHPVATPSAGSYNWTRFLPGNYANGQRVASSNSGSTWAADSTRDFNFRTYMQVGFAPSGNIVSGAKDANPATGFQPNWSTLSWNATTPANTSLNFQVAASNNAGGPFNFVGPDGTSSTFFTASGASLSQFNGFRFLKYKALLATTNSSVAPTLNDVTACFADVPLPAITGNDAQAAEPPTGTTPMVFTVTLGSSPTSTATVSYATADDTATGGTCGSAGVDYQTTSGTLTFNPGETFKTVNVNVCSDASAEANETLLLNLTGPSNATLARAQATGTITPSSVAGTFLISEFRHRGPTNAGDDFVEMYNNTDSPLTVAASDASGGYGLYKMGADCASAPVLIATIPNGTIIPARGHYLTIGSAYSLANYGGTGAAAGDQTMTSDIEDDRSLAVFSTANVSNISSVNRLDAVGFNSNAGGVCDLLREGTGLAPIGAPSGIQYSYFRFMGLAAGGNPKDTNDNSSDFLFADTAGTFITGVTQRLGAPGPENLASPIRRDTSGVGLPLLDQTKASSVAPNRDHSLVPNPGNNSTFGTLSIRRRVTNATGSTVTRLRFRIVEVTTFPSPGAGTADLRAINSSDVVISGITDAATCSSTGTPTTTPCQVTAKGTTLEAPPSQPNGGGYNTTMSVTLPGGGLANNASIDVNFTLGVQQTGTFRFLIIIEALP